MYDPELSAYSFWWIVPVIMMILCFFTMRGRRGWMMCGRYRRQTRDPNSARAILDRRYASGEIDKEEYEEKKRAMAEPAEPASGQR